MILTERSESVPVFRITSIGWLEYPQSLVLGLCPISLLFCDYSHGFTILLSPGDIG